MPVPDAAWRKATALFRGFALDDAGTLAEIRRLKRRAGYLADPHTAIGTAAARALAPEDAGDPRGGRRHRPPRQVPRRGGAGDRRPAPSAAARWPTYMSGRSATPCSPADLAEVEAFVRAHTRRNTAAAA